MLIETLVVEGNKMRRRSEKMPRNSADIVRWLRRQHSSPARARQRQEMQGSFRGCALAVAPRLGFADGQQRNEVRCALQQSGLGSMLGVDVGFD